MDAKLLSRKCISKEMSCKSIYIVQKEKKLKHFFVLYFEAHLSFFAVFQIFKILTY